jgi:hypothetical protein
MKVVGLCPVHRFFSKRAKESLSDIPEDSIDEAVFYLKISGFFAVPITHGESEGRFRCTRKALTELKVMRYSVFDTTLLQLFALAKDPNQKGAAESTVSACAYFLDFDTDLTLELLPQASVTVELMTITHKPDRPSMTNTNRLLKLAKIGMDHLLIKSLRIGLPNLSEFDIQKIPLSLSDAKPRADFRNYRVSHIRCNTARHERG